MWSLYVVASLFVLSALGQEDSPPVLPVPTVNISQGVVTGSVAEDGEYYEFYGIPYADSTAGSHRFKAPSAPPLFSDVFEANRRGIKCVTATGVGYEGTEDCLTVNVFTRSLNVTTPMPVMVWIKGKELNEVQRELSFKHIVDKEVVVVALNFRESILGFLCLGTETAPGNAGMKDIIAGLKWVQENIAHFGGDPDNVSLFGHGSGAAAVDLITMSPMANGLVHKAIAQSGSALAPWAVTRDNLEYAIQVAEALGHIVTNIEELSELFTRTNVAALMAVINDLDLTDNSLAFAPCLEREALKSVDPFLIKSPYRTLLNGEFQQIPFMTGFVDYEGTIRTEQAPEWIERMSESLTDFLQSDLQFANDDEKSEAAEKIKSVYFPNEDIDMSDYITYHGDTMILVSALRESILRAHASSADVFVYQFSYRGILGETFLGESVVERPGHNEELAYLFYDMPQESVADLDISIADIIIERWTNFAKTGLPTSDMLSANDWEPFTLDAPKYLRFLNADEIYEGNLDIVLERPHADTVSFWQYLYEEHFLDAEGRWEISDRNEEEEEGGEEEEEEEEVEEEEVEEEEEEEVEEEEEEEEEGEDVDVVDSFEEASGDDSLEVPTVPPEEESDESSSESDEDNSASTAVGCTFMIITLFSLLAQFHWSQLLE